MLQNKTLGIDTNTLLSFRLKRQPDFSRVKGLFEKCIQRKICIYVPVPVFLEIEWVLRSYYKQPKEIIIEFIEELLSLENVTTDNKEILQTAVRAFKDNGNIGFIDCVIAHQVKYKGYDFLTFDKKLKKLFSDIL